MRLIFYAKYMICKNVTRILFVAISSDDGMSSAEFLGMYLPIISLFSSIG